MRAILVAIVLLLSAGSASAQPSEHLDLMLEFPFLDLPARFPNGRFEDWSDEYRREEFGRSITNLRNSPNFDFLAGNPGTLAEIEQRFDTLDALPLTVGPRLFGDTSPFDPALNLPRISLELLRSRSIELDLDRSLAVDPIVETARIMQEAGTWEGSDLQRDFAVLLNRIEPRQFPLNSPGGVSALERFNAYVGALGVENFRDIDLWLYHQVGTDSTVDVGAFAGVGPGNTYTPPFDWVDNASSQRGGPFAGVALLVHKRELGSGPTDRPTPMFIFSRDIPPCEDDTLDFRFREAPLTAGFCTGFLTQLGDGTQAIATAAHCLQGPQCRSGNASCVVDWRVVFGFNDTSAQPGMTMDLPPFTVFSVAGVHPSSPTVGSDLILLALTETVPGETAPPFAIDRTGLDTIEHGTNLILVGHPNGMPKMIDVNEPVALTPVPGALHQRFVAVDAFAGHSGSPLLRADNGQVVGMLIGGKTDYERQPATAEHGACLVTLRTSDLADAREKALGLNDVP